MVTTKKKPATTTKTKDYSDTSALFDLWNSITELKQASSEYFKTKATLDPDDDIYYEISQEHSKISQQYVDSIFELWKYARNTGAKHGRGEKISVWGDKQYEIAELIPEFDENNNFVKWNYLLMGKNESGETEFVPFITPIVQGDQSVLDSVTPDEPAEPEAIAPEPEPEQLTLLPNELTRDLGNDYLAFKANQLIDLLEKFPREAIAINQYCRTGGKSDPQVAIITSRGSIFCWMDEWSFRIDCEDVDAWFERFGSRTTKPWEDTLDDHFHRIGFCKINDTDLVKIPEPITDPPYEYQDIGDGRYQVSQRIPNKPFLAPIRLGLIWEDKEGWIADDILPAENSRRAIAYRLEQKYKERREEFKREARELVAKVSQATAKKTKTTEKVTPVVNTGKKFITESKPAGKKSKAITESKPAGKKSKAITESKPRAIANSEKPITELKPAPNNSVIATDGKPQGCINWSAPAGGAKVPAGTKYPYYCYHEGGKLRRCYIGGGNQQATVAQSRVRAVEEAIAQSKSPDEIVSLIHELKRG